MAGKVNSKIADKVNEYLEKLIHPKKKEILEIRKIILAADKKLTEQIKWNAPSFCYNGDDRITFNLSGKGFVRLIFHCGAKANSVKPKQNLFEDKTGLLQWADTDRAVMKFNSMEDVKNKKKDLVNVIKIRIELTS